MTPSTLELEQTLRSAVGPIERIERKEFPYYSSYQIEELKVLLADGTILEMILKNLSPQAVLGDARLKPAFLYNPLREIETYRTVLSSCSMGTAKCFHSVTEEGRYWLFLEHVAGVPLWQSEDSSAWRNAARWLAQLHQRNLRMPHLIRYDRAYYGQWWQRALAFEPDMLPAASAYERAVEHLLELPVTLIHGEFYASNVLVQGERICPIDWESAALAPGLIDLAALTAGKWDSQERLDFATAYCGGAAPSEGMLHALECCRLHLAVRWVGWSDGWRAPVREAHNWQREALEIAGRLM